MISITANLISKAMEARKNAYAPYSGFQVGAALLTTQGKIYTGVNIESASYSPTNCAERTAFFAAINNGERSFEAIAIVGGREENYIDYCYPCGVCRQVMAEFCDEETFSIIVAKNINEFQQFYLKDLLPFRFGANHLDGFNQKG